MDIRRATAIKPATRARFVGVARRQVAMVARPVMLVALALVALLGVAEGVAFVVKAFAYPKVGYDFAIYFGAALALRDNPHANIYSLHVLQSAATAHGAALPGALYLYPPVLAVLLIPLTLLPYAVALRLWLVFNLVLWLAGTGLLAAELRRALVGKTVASSSDGHWQRDATAFALGVCIFLGLAYGPLMQAFQLGQVTMLIFAVIAAVPFLLRARHDRTAGVLLALATLLKLFPAVLILYFALRGRRRLVVSAVITLVATTLALLPLLGLDGLLVAGRVLANGGANAQQFHNQSLARVPLWIAAAFGGTPSPALDALGVALIALVVATFVAGVWLAGREREGVAARHDDLEGYMWAVATMVLASPILWEHYDTWLLPVIVLCLGAGVTSTGGSRASALRRLSSLCLCAAILAYALTANALPFAYDGLAAFSPGPYIAGHPIRPYFMLLRPIAGVLLWVAAGTLYLHLRPERNRLGTEMAASAPREMTEALPSAASEATMHVGPGRLAMVTVAMPAAVIALTVVTSLVTSLARP